MKAVVKLSTRVRPEQAAWIKKAAAAFLERYPDEPRLCEEEVVQMALDELMRKAPTPLLFSRRRLKDAT